MTVLAPYGKKWQEIKKMPTLEHELFFSFLMISPSYQKIHRIITKKDKEKTPKNLKEVERLYKKIGSVYGVSFDEWWEGGASDFFFSIEPTDILTIHLDAKKKREQLIKELNELIDAIENSKKSQNIIKFVSNKIRTETLSERYWVVVYKAYQIFYNKKIENWRIGEFLASFGNVKADWAQELVGETKPTAKNLQARERIGQLVSKMVREALYISENAARGKFPCKDPVDGLEFDYQKTYQVALKNQFKYLSTKDQAAANKKMTITEKKWLKYYKENGCWTK